MYIDFLIHLLITIRYYFRKEINIYISLQRDKFRGNSKKTKNRGNILFRNTSNTLSGCNERATMVAVKCMKISWIKVWSRV